MLREIAGVRGLYLCPQHQTDFNPWEHERPANVYLQVSSHAVTMIRKSVTVHSSLLFDPKKKEFVKNVSIRVDCQRGSIAQVYERQSDDEIRDGDIDLRGKVVTCGFVDAHSHIFLHPYRHVPRRRRGSCSAPR